MPDLEISKLPTISGALLQAADPLPMADLSASETKQITVKDLLQGGIALIDDSSIPGAKIDFTPPPGSIGTLEIADKSVTAVKLADESTAIVELTLPSTGAYVGQLGYNESTGKLYIWDGTTWQPFKAAGSINTITYDNTLGPIAMGGVVAGDNVQLGVIPKPTSTGGMFLAGPGSTGGEVDYRQILSTDLPRASTDKGAVVVNGNGLAMVGDAIAIDNSVTPSGATYGVVTYDAYGLIQDGRAISAADLPIASLSDIGAIRPGPSFGISGTGELSLSNAITPGTATKITYDGTGLITAATNLTEDDIPTLQADKIVGGTLVPGLLTDRSIAEIKLADYSTCYVQEGQPGGDSKLGQLWFTPSTNQLRIYTRGSAADNWESIGFGALQTQNLRWGGTIDADTSTLMSLTDIGVSEGLTAGGPIPTPKDELSGLYFVVQTPGSNINLLAVTGTTFTEGDWLLCINQAQGYTALNIAAGGGGGGGASKLADLLDVNITSPMGEQFLQYDAISGSWINAGLVDGGVY